jgi:hypothetical protein
MRAARRTAGPTKEAMERRDSAHDRGVAIAKLYARLFNTDDGKKVLKHLADQTAGTVVPHDAHPAVLPRMEGKRELVSEIFQLVERGMTG